MLFLIEFRIQVKQYSHIVKNDTFSRIYIVLCYLHCNDDKYNRIKVVKGVALSWIYPFIYGITDSLLLLEMISQPSNCFFIHIGG